MKKERNNNTLHPHLLCFWVKGSFKEGVILRTRKKKNEGEEQTENKKNKEKEDEEDIRILILITLRIKGIIKIDIKSFSLIFIIINEKAQNNRTNK